MTQQDQTKMTPYLFRSEDFNGSGIREPKEVILLETCNLGNTDIWTYCLNHYSLSALTKQYITWLQEAFEEENKQEIPEYYYCIIEFIYTAIDCLLDDLKKQFGKELVYCVWLTDYQSVEKYYGRPTTMCKKSDIILSDLGKEGALYAYFEEPMEIRISGRALKEGQLMAA